MLVGVGPTSTQKTQKCPMCGKRVTIDNHVNSVEMVEKHTDMLEAVGRGDDVDSCDFSLLTRGSLGNSPMVWRIGGACLSSTWKTRKFTICVKKGHNQQSCQCILPNENVGNEY
ncbi:hypothetical protein TSUD_160910 [Trifolium subterraneum]|uniref:Uncharacterized protein n=1 Tax=Trifolium subterraneum TaxID=3900 RepID=A0A2Z6MBJ6_TRISU|nr:hypothetical protein TSUD_160910 [Trifolium subterraneum]